MSAPVTFRTPPHGLEPRTSFDLNVIENTDERLFSLRASDNVDLRLFVIDCSLMPLYQPVLNDSQVAELALESADDALVYAIVNPTGAEATVNLLAPIVLNRRTGVAAQIILDGDWPIKHPLHEVV